MTAAVMERERVPLLTVSQSDALNFFDGDRNPYIAIDTETNGYDIRDGRGYLYGLSACTRVPGLGYVSHYFACKHPGNGGYDPLNIDPDVFFELKNKIENYTGVLIFHNAKFDLESLRSVGINYTGRFIDTMLWAHLINENFPFNKGLDSCGKYYLNDAGKLKGPEFNLFMSMYGWAGMPSQVIREYAEYDALLAYRLFEHLLPMMEKEGLLRYWYEHKVDFLNVVRAMERRGVRIDVPMCTRMARHGDLIMEDVRELLGGLNPGSSKDLEKLLIGRLGLGIVKPTKGTKDLPPEEWKPSFDKEAMEVYDRMLELRGDEDETAQLILTYRGWQKAVSSNYRPYVELLSPDGRLRPNYKLHGTRTGRMSCEKPNLQQIPREGDKAWNGDMKLAFLPEEGFTLWEADYAQLELRLGTSYAGDRELIMVFDEGRDVFTEMSERIGMPRHKTKTLVYTIQYGGGLNRISTVFGISTDEASALRSGYYVSYPGFQKVSHLAQQRAKYAGKVKLWSTRYRHFVDREKEAHKAFNSVIQGGAADIVEGTMVRLFNQVDNEEECRMLLTVHDSVIFEVKNGREDYYLPKIREVMENVVPDFGVKFAVDIHKFGDKS